ncbi:MAG TPA: PEPxxWA-CTERM sorting domain-containing protein [Sphingomonas sp.]|nr:PEPxxWA-CTERM sorting domain-containing protein [Sphingomonas sp.]
MRNAFVRSVFIAAGALLCATTASATSFSIDTTVPGGSAWIDGSVGSINGTVNIVSQGVTESAAIGRILLRGQRSDTPVGTLSDMPVFCIDAIHWLASGVFVDQPLSYITAPGGVAQVTYSASQLHDMLKFMVYAQGQGITNQLTSAAAQLGIWEILNETGNNWDVSSGNFNVSLWSGPDAVGLANAWLSAAPATSTAGYALGVLDPGHGNQMQGYLTSAPVPEPASWAMMVAGFGALGAALRRRKQGDALFA